jgi:hypothetical protein
MFEPGRQLSTRIEHGVTKSGGRNCAAKRGG